MRTPRKFPKTRVSRRTEPPRTQYPEPVGSSPAARVSARCARHARVRRHVLVRRASARGVLAGGVIASRAEDPPVHATQVPEDTRSFAAHRVAAHAVSEPVASRAVSPDAHATHAFDATRSFVAHPHAVSWRTPAARSEFPRTRARSRRTESPRTQYPSRWGHRQPRESRPMRTPRTRSTPRARSSRIRTRCLGRWGHRQPRGVIRPCTPRTRSTPRARSRRTDTSRRARQSRRVRELDDRRSCIRTGVRAGGDNANPDPPVHATHGVRRHARSVRTESPRTPRALIAARPSPRQRESRVARGHDAVFEVLDAHALDGPSVRV